MSRAEIYRSGDVVVTATLVEISGTTYAVSSIGSVKVIELPKKGGSGAVLGVIVAVLASVIAFVAFVSRQTGLALFFFAVMILLLVPFARYIGRAKAYALVLATASGDRQALLSQDQPYLWQVRQAVESAMAAAREVRPAADLRRSIGNPIEKNCPRCAESVKAAAVVCRFCGYEFSTLTVE
jgi:multisubunit Na+/H+ antiporter MnhG subunit